MKAICCGKPLTETNLCSGCDMRVDFCVCNQSIQACFCHCHSKVHRVILDGRSIDMCSMQTCDHCSQPIIYTTWDCPNEPEGHFRCYKATQKMVDDHLKECQPVKPIQEDWEKEFDRDFHHTQGLPDGYENWENYYTALKAFIKQREAVVRKETEEKLMESLARGLGKLKAKYPELNTVMKSILYDSLQKEEDK